MDERHAIMIVEGPGYADVTPEEEAREFKILSNASKLNREMKISEAYANAYHKEHCARIHEAKQHQREINNFLIFFLVLAAAVVEVLISVCCPAWVAAIPVVLVALIVRFMK